MYDQKVTKHTPNKTSKPDAFRLGASSVARGKSNTRTQKEKCLYDRNQSCC
jgi:hypothetical protein